MQRRFLPPVLLLAAALIQNGIAVASAANPDTASPVHQAMMHHDHGGMAGHHFAGSTGDQGKPGCCALVICHCGCTATPAALQPATPIFQIPVRMQAVRTGNTGEFRPGTTGAPFRPPA
jgi:hypothetical protein